MPRQRLQEITVSAAYDEEAGVWYVESSSVPGLNLEAESVQALRDKLPGALLDLLGAESADAPVELIARTRTHLKAGAAA